MSPARSAESARARLGRRRRGATVELQLSSLLTRVERRQKSEAAHAGGPRPQRRWRKLAPAQRLDRSASTDPGDAGVCIREAIEHSPIAAIVLTNAEVDSSAGLLALRERQPLVIFGTETTLDAIADNRMFDVVDPAVAPRRAVRLGKPFEPLLGIKLELFSVPGKVPLWLEEENVGTDEIGEETVGVAVEAAAKRLVYAPACARVTQDLEARIANADVLFFDGTLFTDNEMIVNGLGEKTGKRMGHMPVSGPGGTLEASIATAMCGAS